MDLGALINELERGVIIGASPIHFLNRNVVCGAVTVGTTKESRGHAKGVLGELELHDLGKCR